MSRSQALSLEPLSSCVVHVCCVGVWVLYSAVGCSIGVLCSAMGCSNGCCIVLWGALLSMGVWDMGVWDMGVWGMGVGLALFSVLKVTSEDASI